VNELPMTPTVVRGGGAWPAAREGRAARQPRLGVAARQRSSLRRDVIAGARGPARAGVPLQALVADVAS
jgi:hypothetical protein